MTTMDQKSYVNRQRFKKIHERLQKCQTLHNGVEHEANRHTSVSWLPRRRCTLVGARATPALSESHGDPKAEEGTSQTAFCRPTSAITREVGQKPEQLLALRKLIVGVLKNHSVGRQCSLGAFRFELHPPINQESRLFPVGEVDCRTHWQRGNWRVSDRQVFRCFPKTKLAFRIFSKIKNQTQFFLQNQKEVPLFNIVGASSATIYRTEISQLALPAPSRPARTG